LPGISRKELKRDEFASEVSKTYEFLQHQRERLIRIGLVVVVAVVAVVAAYMFSQFRQRRAGEELAHAIRVFYAPVNMVATEPGMEFKDEQTKLAQAEKEFTAIAGKYSWQNAGKVAKYFLGVTHRQMGKTDQAVGELRDVAGSGDRNIAALAKFALAETLAQSGKLPEAEKLYRELADQPADTVSREQALLALADHLAGPRPADAQKIYQELQKQQKQGQPSTVAGIAGQRLNELRK
jgi:predicted negative regulator of RcsB-dependent stress response